MKRTIVISDVHMSDGDDRYCWFSPSDSENLGILLNAISIPSAGVEELIFLGDLFDLWLYPVDVVPWTVNQIIDKNSLVRDAIRKCVKDIPKVCYMNGNHDMTVTEGDLEPLNFSLEKRIQIINTDGYKKDHEGRRHFEHGQAADIFNAKPEKNEDTIEGLPLGYFLTRLTAGAQPGIWQTLRKICQDFLVGLFGVLKAEESLKTSFTGPLLVKLLINGIQLQTSIDDDTRIRFAESDLDEKYTVGDIKEHYGDLLAIWQEKYSGLDLLGSMFASRGFGGGLKWYADKILSSEIPPKLVVMGHTHQFIVDHNGYSNDGAFCGSENLSCLEVIDDKTAVIARLVTERH